MIVQTIGYFLTWGVLYGLLLGALTGTALFPVVGTFIGAGIGAVSGLIGGLIAGLAAIAFGVSQIDIDTDLSAYRRQFAHYVGLSVVIVPLIAWVVGSFLILGVIGMGLLLPLALPWAGLSMAYVAHRYPDVVIKRLFKGKRGEFGSYVDDFQLQIDTIAVSWALLWGSGSRKLRGLLGAGILALIHLLTLLSYPSFSSQLNIPQILEIIIVAAGGALLAEVIWAYIALGSSLLVTFIKKLILKDYFPNISLILHRGIITLISFLLTWAMIWWTTFPGPIIAGIMAYAVYHTLALPDEAPEKAKRKEKNALALEEESEEGVFLVDESELIESQHRLLSR